MACIFLQRRLDYDRPTLSNFLQIDACYHVAPIAHVKGATLHHHVKSRKPYIIRTAMASSPNLIMSSTLENTLVRDL